MNVSTICHGDFATIPRELFDFARRQVANALMYKGDERRRELRNPMVVPVRMVAVDECNQPIGDPFQVVTRDVSKNTVGLIHFDEIAEDRFAIHMQLAQTDVFMVIRIVWSGPTGPFYGAAGEYIQKLTAFPVEDDEFK